MNKKDITAAALFLLTFSTAAEINDATRAEYYATSTAEALAIVAQVAAEGVTVHHVTIKSI